jgi:PIN domain nuclease of toxin-antitoxin system
MRYLIDSNIFLFALYDEELLIRDVKHILRDDANIICISAENVKEIMYLLRSGKFMAKNQMAAEDVIDFIKNDTNFQIRYMGEEHLRTLSKLPILKDHGDPYDRAIIAHAITEKITLISSDTKFSWYERFGLDFIYNKKK